MALLLQHYGREAFLEQNQTTTTKTKQNKQKGKSYNEED